MIPYDDLVVALQTWRARQGLPVAQLSGVAITPPPAPAPAPPAPPKAAVPPPLAPAQDTRDEEIEESAALIEEAHYENEGDDFAMSFNGQAPPPAEQDDESTSIGSAPGVARDSFSGGGTEPDKGGNSDW